MIGYPILMNMKKLIVIATALFLMAGYMVNAQTSHNHNHNNKQDQKQNMTMQKKGMMQDMMNQNMPMEKYMMMVNQLPNMQQQLSLSDMQMEQLNDLQAGFKKQQIDFQSELQKKQAKLKSLLDDMAPVNQVEKQMQECANTKISMGLAAYETAGKMKAVLNNDQQEVLNNRMIQQGGMMNPKQNGMMQKRDEMMNHDHGEEMQNKNKQ